MNNSSVFDVYPQFVTLRGKVPDEIVEREVAPKATQFAEISPAARQHIPTVPLANVFPAEIEEGKIQLQHFLGQWGNISVEEVCKIALICSWLRPKTIFEFGTYNGMTTLQLALNSPPDCIVHTLDLDPLSPETAALDVGEIDGFLARKQGAFGLPVGGYFASRPLATKVRQLLGNSLAFDFSPYHHAMDMIFVDAGHTYECVKSDTSAALRMIRPGGVILWHDYMQLLHPDVTRHLVECSLAGYRIFHLRGTHLAVYYHNPK